MKHINSLLYYIVQVPVILFGLFMLGEAFKTGGTMPFIIAGITFIFAKLRDIDRSIRLTKTVKAPETEKSE
jgi:hypothetical protein